MLSESVSDLARTLVVILSGGALGVLVVAFNVTVKTYREDPRPVHAELLGTGLAALGLAGLIVINAARSIERIGNPAPTWHLFASLLALVVLLAGLVWVARFNWKARIDRAAKRTVLGE